MGTMTFARFLASNDAVAMIYLGLVIVALAVVFFLPSSPRGGDRE